MSNHLSEALAPENSRKKVVHLTLFLDIGGLERMIYLLSREQKKLGWDVRAIVYEKNTGDLANLFQRAGIPVLFLGKGPGFSIRLPFQIWRLLRAEDITLIHSHDLGALIYASLVRLISLGRVRIVHTQHSFQHLHAPKARLYEKIFPRFARRIACVSEDLRRAYLSLGLPFAKLRIVPNGVDFDAPSWPPANRTQLRRELLRECGQPEALAEKPWVITLGRLATVKGPQHAVSAWALAQTGNAVLFCVGPIVEPALVAELKKTAPANVIFPGPTQEPQRWLAACDLFFSASEFEGLPLAALEAAAARRPMLLSEIPGHAMFRGWAAYYSPGNSSAAAAQLEQFLGKGSFAGGFGQTAVIEGLERDCGARRMAEAYDKIYGE